MTNLWQLWQICNVKQWQIGFSALSSNKIIVTMNNLSIEVLVKWQKFCHSDLEYLITLTKIGQSFDNCCCQVTIMCYRVMYRRSSNLISRVKLTSLWQCTHIIWLLIDKHATQSKSFVKTNTTNLVVKGSYTKLILNLWRNIDNDNYQTC